MPTGHFGLDMLENEVDRVLEIAKVADMKAIFCPYLDADRRPDSVAGWQEFGKRLAIAGEHYRKAGYAFGWHNHDFEFRPLADGSVPQEHILDASPDLAWEADIAWIIKGGADPLEWIRRYGDRILAVHVKDIAIAGEKPTKTAGKTSDMALWTGLNCLRLCARRPSAISSWNTIIRRTTPDLRAVPSKP